LETAGKQAQPACRGWAHTCTLWLPIAAEHVEKAMEWVAAEVTP